jgi:hypothetical protein
VKLTSATAEVKNAQYFEWGCSPTVGRRILYTEKLHNLYSQLNITSVNKSGGKYGRIARMGEKENAYKFWLENLKRRRGRPNQGWKDNIKIYIREIVCEGVG